MTLVRPLALFITLSTTPEHGSLSRKSRIRAHVSRHHVPHGHGFGHTPPMKGTFSLSRFYAAYDRLIWCAVVMYTVPHAQVTLRAVRLGTGDPTWARRQLGLAHDGQCGCAYTM